MNKKILLCIRNVLVSDGIIGFLAKKNASIQIVEERSMQLFFNTMNYHQPDILVIEVKGIRPYTMSEWFTRIERVREKQPTCKVAVIVDEETYPETSELVKREKMLGTIDAFFYVGSGLNYLVDVLDSL